MVASSPYSSCTYHSSAKRLRNNIQYAAFASLKPALPHTWVHVFGYSSRQIKPHDSIPPTKVLFIGTSVFMFATPEHDDFMAVGGLTCKILQSQCLQVM